jgi:transcriptional regulator GlxA family with amidase domain
MTAERSTSTHVFLIVDGAAMMSLASAIEPLRAFNRLSDRQFYNWRVVSLDGGPMELSNRIVVGTEPIEHALADAAVVYVCGGLHLLPAGELRYVSLLRRLAQRGQRLGALSNGAYLLARAGLLNGYRCTLHWEHQPAFEKAFPDVQCTGKLFEIDRDRLTCCGATAAMDMMLDLIGREHGEAWAEAVANQFHHERIRPHDDDQRGGARAALLNAPREVRDAVATMRKHMEDCVSVAQIASATGTSTRRLERMFLRHLGTTPGRYYLGLRLERARHLLLYSEMPTVNVASASGFASTSHFAGQFRRVFGQRPSELRASSAVPRARLLVRQRSQ